MSEPRRWTIHVCPYCGEQVYSDGWFPCGHDETRFCLEHPEYEQEVDASGTHTSFVGGEQVPARSLVPREVEVVEAALPDDQLRERLADTLGRVMPQSIPFERERMLMLADAAIDVVRGVSATPAPPEQAKTLDELAPAWERYAARGFTDEDVERMAEIVYEGVFDAAALLHHWPEAGDGIRDPFRRAVLAAVGPKEERDE